MCDYEYILSWFVLVWLRGRVVLECEYVFCVCVCRVLLSDCAFENWPMYRRSFFFVRRWVTMG